MTYRTYRYTGFTDSIRQTMEALIFFNINFNNNENNCLSLAYGCRNDVHILDKFDANGLCIFLF